MFAYCANDDNWLLHLQANFVKPIVRNSELYGITPGVTLAGM